MSESIEHIQNKKYVDIRENDHTVTGINILQNIDSVFNFHVSNSMRNLLFSYMSVQPHKQCQTKRVHYEIFTDY